MGKRRTLQPVSIELGQRWRARDDKSVWEVVAVERWVALPGRSHRCWQRQGAGALGPNTVYVTLRRPDARDERVLDRTLLREFKRVGAAEPSTPPRRARYAQA